jgi:membrane-associated phospholipid phosphatase
MTATLSAPPAPAPARDRRAVVVGVLTSLVAGVAFVGVYVVAVRTRAGQYVDERLMDWAASTAGEGAVWAESLLETVGSAPSLLLATAAVVTVALLLHGPRRAVAVAVVAAGTVIGSQVLKATLDRPLLTDELAHNSFPSGHVAAVAGVLAALVLAAPRVLRPLLVLAGSVVVALVGLATTALEWHRPSDVLGSVLLAVTLAGLAAALSRRRPPVD